MIDYCNTWKTELNGAPHKARKATRMRLGGASKGIRTQAAITDITTLFPARVQNERDQEVFQPFLDN